MTFFVVQQGSAAKKRGGNRKCSQWFFVVQFGLVWLGGSKDTGGPSSQEEKPPQVAQHGHKKFDFVV